MKIWLKLVSEIQIDQCLDIQKISKSIKLAHLTKLNSEYKQFLSVRKIILRSTNSDYFPRYFLKIISNHIINKKKTLKIESYRSLSSAACEASASLAVAVAKRSSDLSRSSSRSWMRRFKAATSDSACNNKKLHRYFTFCYGTYKKFIFYFV